jgi:hypothetical protein
MKTTLNLMVLSWGLLAACSGGGESQGGTPDAPGTISDGARDAVPETPGTTNDATSDTPATSNDVVSETRSDIGPEAAADVRPDVSADIPPDGRGDVSADNMPDASMDVAPDACTGDRCVCTMTAPIPFVDDARGHGPMVRVVSNGNGYGVAWGARVDEAGPPEIFFRLLDRNGAPVGPPKRITDAPGLSLAPSLVWTGTHYGLAWHDGRDAAPDAAPGAGGAEIYFARLDANGEKIGADVRVSNFLSQSFRPSLVWNGTEFAVTWNDDRDGNHEIYFARLDANGAPAGGEVRVSNASGSSLFSDLTAVRGGAASTGYGVVWQDDRDGNIEVYFSRLDAMGTAAGAVRITTTPLASGDAHIAWNGTGFGVAWIDEKPGDADVSSYVYFAQLSETGAKVGSDVMVRDADGRADVPIIAWNGAEYGLGWRDTRSGPAGELYFARLTTGGVKIAPERNLTMDALDTTGLWLIADGARYAAAYHSGAPDGSAAGKYFLGICP